MKKFVPLFIIIAILDLYIVVRAIMNIGFGQTILLIILTGIGGFYLAKTEGLLVFDDIKYSLDKKEVPGDELLSGLCIVIGGILIFMPGILTDIIGISMVIPFTRNYYRDFLKLKISNFINKVN